MSAATLTDTTVTSAVSHGSSSTTLPTPQPDFVSSGDRLEALVIGDLHGHLDRLEGLLKQEGLLVQCRACDGFGDVPTGEINGGDCSLVECDRCHGDGWARARPEVNVILLGDVGHFGQGGSPTGDMLTWLYATRWADVILWGNHDRAVFEHQHAHRDLLPPNEYTCALMLNSARSGQLLLAYATHGFLLTHAGLHTSFRDQKIDDKLKTDPYAFADWINQLTDPFGVIPDDRNLVGIVDSISRRRGGFAHAGGILWRDIEEKLYPGFRQIFGHSADHKEHRVRYCWEAMHSRVEFPNLEPPVGYCIDIGGKDDHKGSSEHCVAGIWLPEERIVTWHG